MMMKIRLLLSLFFLLPFLIKAQLIHQIKIIDGTGRPAFNGSVRIDYMDTLNAMMNRMPVQISHIKLGKKSDWGTAKIIIEKLEAARKEGIFHENTWPVCA